MFKFNTLKNNQLFALKYPIDIAANLPFVVSSVRQGCFSPQKEGEGRPSWQSYINLYDTSHCGGRIEALLY